MLATTAIAVADHSFLTFFRGIGVAISGGHDTNTAILAVWHRRKRTAISTDVGHMKRVFPQTTTRVAGSLMREPFAEDAL